ncbi:MAG: AAA family ATPase, partial [Bacteroidota bacterium]
METPDTAPASGPDSPPASVPPASVPASEAASPEAVPPEGAPAPAAAPASEADALFAPAADLAPVADAVDALRAEIGKLIVGQAGLIDELIAAVLAGGHVLIEGVPGVAKTLTAKLLAKALGLDYSRIQFTPDLMPADVLGTNVFSPASGAFDFHPGPIFAQVVLIDEINRAPAKTQAALFETMEERQATIDGTTYP